MTRAAYLTGLATVFALILLPAVARADLGVQADRDLLNLQEQPRVFAQAHQLDAGWIRIMVDDRRLPQIRQAVIAAHRDGFRVLGTLTRWRGIGGFERAGATPAEWAAFTRTAVTLLGRWVDAWETMNEPNGHAFAPAVGTVCHVTHRTGRVASVRIVNGTRVSTVYRRGHFRRYRRRHGHRYHGPRFRRVRRWQRVKHGHHRRHHHGRWRRVPAGFKRARHGRYVQRVRREPVTTSRTIWISTDDQVRQCAEQAVAAAYRDLHDVAAKIIRSLDPSATVILGGPSPSSTNMAFMRQMIDARPGLPDADYLGVHPYCWCDPTLHAYPGSFRVTNIENTVAWARARGWGVLATEFGEKPTLPASWVREAVDRMTRAGVKLTVLYELNRPVPGVWDTSLVDVHGRPRPAFSAIGDR